MLEKEVKNSFTIFNDLINNLISSFTKYNLDEDSIILLAKMTKHLMTFTQKILLQLLFKFFKKVSFLRNMISEDIIDIDAMVDAIFEEINIKLNEILAEKQYENKQHNIDEIIEYLTFLKDLINTLSNLFISVLKFDAEVIEEDEFREEYRKFKKDISKDKVTLDKLLDKEMVTIPITWLKDW